MSIDKSNASHFISALKDLHKAADEVWGEWDWNADDWTLEGYPAYLPDFAEVVHDLKVWAEKAEAAAKAKLTK